MLDILTKKGQETANYEQRAYEIFLSNYSSYTIVETDKTKASIIDSFIVKNNTIQYMAEVKTRYTSYATLTNQFNNEWLITAEKLNKAKEISKNLCVPLVGLLYLVKDDVLLSIQLTDDNGEYIQSIRFEKTKTKTTVNNSNLIERENAFILMTKAKKLSYIPI